MMNFSCASECNFKNKGLQSLVIADTHASLETPGKHMLNYKFVIGRMYHDVIILKLI